MLDVAPLPVPAGWPAAPTLAPLPEGGLPCTGLSSPASGAFNANAVRGAYGLGTYSSGVLSGGISFDGLKGDGSGQTIAIVDPYDDPGLVSSTAPNFSTSDLAVFDAAMHLPDPPSFQKVNEYGNASPLPAASGSSGWSLEESLDVEWAHAMAPKAAIILFETEDFPHVTTGVNSAENTAGVVAVSMSWAVPEFSAESQSQYDSLYTTPTNHYGGNNGVGGSNLPGGVTFLAASGDYGVYGLGGTTIGRLYPAVSPNVVAVGGTTLTVSGSDPNYTYAGEATWGNGASTDTLGGGGGGVSLIENQPAYQSVVVPTSFSESYLSTPMRSYPDVSADANNNTGVAVVVNVGSASVTGANTINISPADGTTSLTPGTYTLVNVAGGGLSGGSFTLGNSTITVGGATYYLSLGGSDTELTLTIDAPPQVVGVYVLGSTWSSAYLSALAAAGVGDATLGFRLADGTGQLANANIPGSVDADQVTIVFSEPVNVASASLGLEDSSSNGGIASGITVVGPPVMSDNNTVATWTLSGPLTSNKYYLELAAAGVTDAAGTELDGNWTTGVSTYAAGSGNGVPGGNFNFEFYVLAGDVNHDGKVTIADFNAIRYNSSLTVDATNWQYDVNGDGKITIADANASRSVSGFTVYSFPEPVAPSP